jgi:F0F1-type ATP synthase epsilon subunit
VIFMVRLISVIVLLAGLVACDARQAIAAARVAGASERAPADLDAAQAAIARAEAHLEAQEYTRARIAALEAKHRAAAALANSEHPVSQ